MPELINERKVFSLIEVAVSIQKAIAQRYGSVFWVKAEMNKLNHYTHSGHCYPELVEKTEGKVVAQMKSNLWKTDFERINANFLKVLNEPLREGIKILFCASLGFDPIHGLSLRILDIDPSFSLGELEREKQETLRRLKNEGIFHSNRMKKLPLLPQRIAVISVETSKGYSDFLKVIDQNPWGYKFFTYLFPSLLQGEKSIASICHQLTRIKKVIHHFDVVAIIRGGGGDVGLSSFNNIILARAIALFPIPILTGIGHSTNETVVEMISHKNAITPTDLADFLIRKFHDFSEPIKRGEEIIVDRARRLLTDEKLKFKNSIKYFRSVTNNKLAKCQGEIRSQSESILQHSKFLIRRNVELLSRREQDFQKSLGIFFSSRLEGIEGVVEGLQTATAAKIAEEINAVRRIEKHVDILDPINILRRGFSITLYNGKAIKSSGEIKPNDQITTVLADGQLESEVKKALNEKK